MSTVAETSSNIVVDTSSGPIRGRVKDNVFLFAGIPYAAPPTEDLRFKAARAHPGWAEIRDATKFGPAAPQVPTGGMTGSVPVEWAEDCLFVNISTPALDDSKRPVLFWIHGGGFRTGQGAIPWYNGASFARNGDIVVVSINYRMGALGFTDLSRFGDEYATSGINGILDQITALRWVQENIAHFGGDPAQVTIAGESAGAFSVGAMLGSPKAEGLFQRAVLQSGAAHHTLPPVAGDRAADLLLKTLNVAAIDELLATSVGDILAAQREIDAELQRGNLSDSLGVAVSPFYPVIGNEVLPKSPIEAISEGQSADIDVLLGTNKDEATLFVTGNVDDAKLEKQAERYGGGRALLDTYRTALPEASALELSIAMSTDFTFRIPALRVAEAREQHHANTWMYWFTWESRNPKLKATHALEIPFVFNNLDKPGVDVFIGDGPRPQSVSDDMHTAWTRFIRGGDPGWPVYTSEERINMRFDEPSNQVVDPDAGRREAWDGLRRGNL